MNAVCGSTLVLFVVPFVVVVINSGLYAALDLVFYSVSDLIVIAIIGTVPVPIVPGVLSDVATSAINSVVWIGVIKRTEKKTFA